MNIGRTFVASFVLATLLVSMLPLALAQGPGSRPDIAFKIPDHAREVSEGVFDIGTVDVEGTRVRGLIFVHNVKAFGHNPNAPPNHGGGGGGGGGGEEGDTSCFSLITFRKVKWRTTEDYVIDTTNNDGLLPAFVQDTIATTLGTWDSEVRFNIFGSLDTSTTGNGADTVAPDGMNEIMFDPIDDGVANGGAVAVTIVWFTAIGRPEILEYDMVFDDVDFDFADVIAGGDPTKMDFAAIATHEEGHALGLGHPAFSCTEETMFGSIAFGETKKRTLHRGDIAGVNNIY